MSDNNGNLLKQQIYIPGHQMRWQQYDYDSLNRLNWAREVLDGGAEQWKQQFTYDRWGNRTINTAVTYGLGINNKAFTVNTANNRLGVPSGQTGVMTYDAAGNLTNDTYTGAGNRTYDAENKITSAWGGNNQAQLYAYDGGGQRIKRTVEGVQTWHVYGFGGELIAEYAASGAATNPQKEYGYRNGQLLVTAAGQSQQSTENIAWTGAVNVTVNGNSLAKSAATSAWDAGANSTKSIASGDGYVEMTVSETNKDRMFGLTRNQTTVSYTDINFALRAHSSGNLYVFELGTSRGLVGSYVVGDKLRVAIENGVVKYKKISGATTTTLYTSAVSPSYPLVADTSCYTPGGTVSSATISGNLSAGTQVQWLVADHLGTPRMILDQTGSLANMKRHDYLPFGEELVAPTGGRSAAQGYSGGDGVRQQFTLKERDVETGLDYFLARYYASTQGRFTSPDEFTGGPVEVIAKAAESNPTFYADLTNPQTLNKYNYCVNNPLRYVDPSGHQEQEPSSFTKWLQSLMRELLNKPTQKKKIAGDRSHSILMR